MLTKFFFPMWAFGGRASFSNALGCVGLGTWAAVVSVGSTVVGAGVSMYGANKQAKANAAAQNANIAAQKEAERQNWLRYLMTRGINPDPNTPTGTIPGAAPGAPVNTRLPLWMRVVTPPQENLRQASAATRAANMPFLRQKE